MILYSAEFDGSSGTIEIDNIIIDSTAFTMEGWFKANTLPSGDYYNLLCYGDSYYTEGAIVLTLLKGDNQLHPRVWDTGLLEEMSVWALGIT